MAFRFVRAEGGACAPRSASKGDTISTAVEQAVTSTPEFLSGGGEMGALMRAYDWTGSPLGPAHAWPQSLKTALRIVLSSRYAMWMAWGDDLAFFYNDAYGAQTLGKKHPWALGKPAREVWAEIWEDIGPRIQRVLDTGEATWDEDLLLFLERSGFREETYHTFSYSPLADDDGRIAGMLCVVTEATERVIGERRLASLRELAAQTAQARSAEEACVRAARALNANRRDFPFATLYLADWDAGRLVLAGASGVEPGHPAAARELDLAGPASPMRRAALDARLTPVPSMDFLGPLPGGDWETPPTQGVVLPLYGATGGVAGTLGVALNPFRPLDDGYRSFLELAAGQISTAISNARAYEEERRRAEALAELDRAKTTFFSNVSHEFRTPLTLMLGPLEELRSDADADARTAGLAAAAHRNGLRLLKLVNSLLDFSRIEAGRAEAGYEPTDLAAFTAELASSFRSATDRAGLKLEVLAPPLPQPVYVDRDMWEKVVLNLLSNAFKFTFEGGITVSVRPGADGEGVELEVRDTGVGIPAEELPHLFERFHRVEGTRGRSFEGSGIGLALVDELVKLHGGSIRVESEPGQGSAFIVALPYGPSHLPSGQVRSDRPTAPTAVRPQAYVDEALRWLPGARAPTPELVDADAQLPEPQAEARGGTQGLVLLADDNADMRDYLSRLLGSRGYAVTAAADGVQALEAARRVRPDVVLSDVMMPELDGFGLLRAFRADPELSDVPVILLSARAGEEARVEGLDAGADDYLTKPFSARELIARVGSNLQLARTRREGREALREEARALELLNGVGSAVAAELDLGRAVQTVTDAATELSGAAFGSFFYNVVDDQGESYTLYALSGAPREAFSRFPMPRNTQVFAATFSGAGVVRSDDITKDPRYGHSAPHHGQPEGHLPVRSYLAAPVVSRSGEVLGGLFFGHPQVGVFTERAERIVVGIAAQAAIAIDNARLFQAAQREIDRRTQTELALRDSEERQLRLNEALEQRVTDRTAELAAANRQLLRQIEERERVEATLRQMQRLEAVGQLTSGVAHDFNNLLTVILGGLDFVERGVSDPKQRRPLGLVREAAERGAKLTAQLLAFSRKQRLDPKPLNLNETIGGMRDLLESTLGGAMRLEVSLQPDLWPALVDPTQIELVILNLAINARDAMEVGGELSLETRNQTLTEPSTRPEEPEPGDYVVISVADTGSGMTPEVLAKAFEPFFTTKPIGKGSGLGLAQVFGFAKQSGGGVAIQTRPGEGTRVSVYVPRAATPAVADRPRAAPAASMVRNGRTILLVDDDEAVREIEAAALDHMGYEVIQAGSGGAALELLEARPEIDVLVADFAMPGMNGAELARRAAEVRPELPVLFVTGYGDLESLAEAGEQRVVQKPFKPEELGQKLAGLLLQAGPSPAVAEGAEG